MTESEIEKKVCAYAKNKGWLVYKFVSPSNRGVPDRIWLKNGVILFVEFKATNKVLTKLQTKTICNIAGQGFLVYVIDSVSKGKSLVDSHTVDFFF